jgi:maleate cis-trans isomerase
MYGTRARIGYTCPVYLAEIFPYDFYKIVPEGVTLVTATASVWQGTPEELRRSAGQALEAAAEMARSGVDLIVLGGVPVNLASGHASVEELARKVQEECGVPVTASLLCQNHALQALGAKKVVVLSPGATTGRNSGHVAEMERLGCAVLDVRGAGSAMYGKPLPAAETLELGRAILRANPDADTLHCSSPHWPMAANIELLEQEFDVNVVTAGQAIIWEALRTCGIDDRISGYGRLLREM